MAEDKRYSIISVVEDEEDDVVIQAGAVPRQADAPDGPSGADGASAAVAEDGAPASGEGTAAVAPDEASRSPEERRRLARAAARQAELDRLRQTEASLSAKPEQPRMRKVVLAALAVGVVVFAVCYYVFFMA